MKKYYRNLFALVIMMLGLLTSTQAQVPSYVPTTGLVSWYPFNGDADDESNNGNDGIIGVGVSNTTNRFNVSNTALFFNGSFASNSGVSIPHNTALSIGTGLNKEFTISLWFKNDTLLGGGGVSGSLMKKGFGNSTVVDYHLLLENNSVYWGTGPSTSSGGDACSWMSIVRPQSGSWNHIVVTINQSINANSGIKKIYINGVLQKTCQYIHKNGANQDPVDVGIGGYVGSIDEIGIWNRELSSTEILSLYNGCNVSISQQPQNVTTTVGSTVTFNVLVQNPNATTYQWQTNLGLGWIDLFNAGQFNNVTTNILSVNNVNINNSNQVFRCLVTKNGCTDTSDAAILTVSGIGIEESNAQKITVFPNPATNHFKVKVPSLYLKGSITVSDVLGRIIETQIINGEEVEVSLPQGFKGLVLVKLEDDNSSLVHIERVLIQ